MTKTRSESDSAHNYPWPLASLPPVPMRFVVCTEDRFFPAALLRRVAAERLGVVADEIAASHCVALSQPQLLGNLLDSYTRTAVSCVQSRHRAASKGPRPASSCARRQCAWRGLRGAGDVPLAERYLRCVRESATAQQMFEGHGCVGRIVGEQCAISIAASAHVDISGRADHYETTPRPSSARVLQHREQQQVLDPHRGEF